MKLIICTLALPHPAKCDVCNYIHTEGHADMKSEEVRYLFQNDLLTENFNKHF